MSNIRALREQHGMTQAQLAKLMHRNQNIISYWEHGKIPSQDAINDLCIIFNCSQADLGFSKKLKMKEVLTKEAYEGLTADERRYILKVEQAKECSGLRPYVDTCAAVFADIPSDWWNTYSAEHIGEVARMLKMVYDRGRNNQSKQNG